MFETLAPKLMNRDARLKLLAELVETGDYRTQKALVSALQEHGVEVTQSSISRDIQALGLDKRDGVYVLAPVEPALPWSLVTDVISAGDHMLVVKTRIAAAQQVASAIDRADWADVIGTVAGDDTLFVATGSAADNRRVRHRIRQSAGLATSPS